MADYFVCLDTNVLFALVQEIERGESPKWWTDLRSLVEADKVTVLVPEITLLELETCIRDQEDKLIRESAKMPSKTEHDAIKQYLGKPLEDLVKKLVQGWRTETDKIEEWLRAKPENVIEYTEGIAHRSKRRLIAGRHPRAPIDDPEANSAYKKWLRDQDSSIIESLIDWFSGKIGDRILAFGSRDSEKKDGGFGPVEDGKGSLNKEKKESEKFEKGVGILDKTFAEGLPPTQLFNDMDKLLTFVTKKEQVKSLTPEEQAIVQELKLQQEATAEALKTVVAAFDVPLGWLQTIESQQTANNNVITGHHIMRVRHLPGFRHGPYLVEVSEPVGGDQPFSDTQSPPPSVPPTNEQEQPKT